MDSEQYKRLQIHQIADDILKYCKKNNKNINWTFAIFIAEHIYEKYFPIKYI